eukprot:UN0138
MPCMHGVQGATLRKSQDRLLWGGAPPLQVYRLGRLGHVHALARTCALLRVLARCRAFMHSAFDGRQPLSAQRSGHCSQQGGAGEASLPMSTAPL